MTTSYELIECLQLDSGNLAPRREKRLPYSDVKVVDEPHQRINDSAEDHLAALAHGPGPHGAPFVPVKKVIYPRVRQARRRVQGIESSLEDEMLKKFEGLSPDQRDAILNLITRNSRVRALINTGDPNNASNPDVNAAAARQGAGFPPTAYVSPDQDGNLEAISEAGDSTVHNVRASVEAVPSTVLRAAVSHAVNAAIDPRGFTVGPGGGGGHGFGVPLDDFPIHDYVLQSTRDKDEEEAERKRLAARSGRRRELGLGGGVDAAGISPSTADLTVGGARDRGASSVGATTANGRLSSNVANGRRARRESELVEASQEMFQGLTPREKYSAFMTEKNKTRMDKEDVENMEEITSLQEMKQVMFSLHRWVTDVLDSPVVLHDPIADNETAQGGSGNSNLIEFERPHTAANMLSSSPAAGASAANGNSPSNASPGGSLIPPSLAGGNASGNAPSGGNGGAGQPGTNADGTIAGGDFDILLNAWKPSILETKPPIRLNVIEERNPPESLIQSLRENLSNEIGASFLEHASKRAGRKAAADKNKEKHRKAKYGSWYVKPTLWQEFMQKDAERGEDKTAKTHRFGGLVQKKLDEIMAQRAKEDALLQQAANQLASQPPPVPPTIPSTAVGATPLVAGSNANPPTPIAANAVGSAIDAPTLEVVVQGTEISDEVQVDQALTRESRPQRENEEGDEFKMVCASNICEVHFPMSLSQDDFRKLLATPRAVAAKQPKEKKPKPPQTPKPNAAGEGKKDDFEFAKPEVPKKKKEWKKPAAKEDTGPVFRDRAKERREGVNPDYADTEQILAMLSKEREEAEKGEGEKNDKSAANLEYDKSKYLGGVVTHTHLVKGLDFALLNKVREEIDAEDEVARSEREAREYLESLHGEEGRPTMVSKLAESVYRLAIEKPQHPKHNDFFREGRSAFVFDLGRDSDDVPTMLIRSRSEMKDDKSAQKVDVVMEKIADIFEHRRTLGSTNAEKKKKKKENDKAALEEKKKAEVAKTSAPSSDPMQDDEE
ncbi:hypothetical protein HK101_002100 [Irineochytrium annulatum]|nr:hypothetical protein HK101_002100 [Irineochytrium annulatum]